MRLVLVDTSVWVDFFNGANSRQTDQLSALLEKGGLVCVSPTIVQEILQGISDTGSFDEIQKHLLRQIVLVCDPIDSAIQAARIYQTLRRKGVTIRKSNDCLIAYHALHYDASILHNDKDYENIAMHTSLRLYSDDDLF